MRILNCSAVVGGVDPYDIPMEEFMDTIVSLDKLEAEREGNANPHADALSRQVEAMRRNGRR